jgi:hypothetical protein
MHARYTELVALDQRTLLSPAEEVLAIPYLSQRSVMSLLWQEEALPLRSASRACRDAVAEHAWGDWREGHSLVKGSLAAWRRCFPHATAVSLNMHTRAQDADLVHLRGIHKVDIQGCTQITDAGLAHLHGVLELYMDRCTGVTDAGLAHLAGIHTLYAWDVQITDAALAHLSGIFKLDISGCTLVTDAGLAHLRGIHTLHMDGCTRITDAGLEHISSVHTLQMRNCPQITAAGVAHLKKLCVLRTRGCTLRVLEGLPVGAVVSD